MGSLGVSWTRISGVLGCVLECQRVSWSHFGGRWCHFRMFWKDLGEVWESLGGFLGAFLEVFCDLEENAKMVKNLGKPMVFH